VKGVINPLDERNDKIALALKKIGVRVRPKVAIHTPTIDEQVALEAEQDTTRFDANEDIA